MLIISGLSAQTQFKSEAEMIKAADAFYNAGNYKDAMPLFSQLVSLYPKDGPYNMKYGNCLFHAERDKTACLKYLKYAAGKEDAAPISYFLFASALHANYEFPKAISQYNKFKSTGNKKEVEQFQVDRLIEMCNNGKSLLSGVFDLNVISKQEIGESEFFRIYDLGDIGGKIIVKPDDFKSKIDLKSTDISLIHLPADATMVYYSGYGDNATNGKDIFRVRKTPEGFSSPENIGAPVNTPYDEDFPFMHPDGTLYFASKGHNSMGGYDLFKSTFNESTNTWSKPENLNFAVSSAFDDVLYISDVRNQLAYFASRRGTVDGKMNVYRVQISRKPMDIAFIKGSFISEGSKEIKSAKISVYDLDGNEKVGTYFTDPNTGNYNIHLPKSGTTYKFIVETDDNSPVHTGKVEVPEQTELASLQQEIRLVGDGDSQKLVIKNLFDPTSTTAVEEEAMLALLRDASDLEVNTTEAEALSQAPAAEVAKPATPDLGAELSVKAQFDALVLEMEKMAADLNQNVADLKNEIAFAFKYSNDKALIADSKYDDIEVLRQQMMNESDEVAKQGLLTKLMALRNETEPTTSEAIVAYDFARSLANEYDEKISDADRVRESLSAAKANPNISTEDMQASINQNQALVSDISGMQSVYEIAPQRYKDLLASTSEKFEREEKYYNDLKRDVEALYTEIDRLDKEIASNKNKKAVQQMTEEKSAKQIDLEDLEYQLSDVRKKYNSLKAEQRNLEADSKQMNAFITKIRTNKARVQPLSVEDQEKLKKLIDYFKEQRLIEDMIGEEIEPALALQESKNQETAQYYPATDNSGKEIEYDEMYFANLAVIELIADAGKKSEESAKLYDNWARTVAEDKKIKQNDLAFTKDKSEKSLLEEQIKILDEKEVLYKVKAQNFREEALVYASGGTPETVAGAEKAASTDVTVAATEKADGATETAEQGGGKTTTTGSAKSAPSVADVKSSTSMQAMLVAALPVAAVANSVDEINSAYEGPVKELEAESDDPVAHITLAAFELSWARDIDALIDEKEKELYAEKDPARRSEISAEISALQTEKKQHTQNAASEFSDLEIAESMGEAGLEADENMKVNYDAKSNADFDYHANYTEIKKNIENDPFLTSVQKSEKLAQLHSFWAQTIQDEIIHLNSVMKETKSSGERKKIQTKIDELQVKKLEQIKKSNRHYEIYRKATAGPAVAATGAEGAKPTAETPGGAVTGLGAATTFSSIENQAAEEVSALEGSIAEKESSLAEASSKQEKQQVALELALLKNEKADNDKAVAELEAKGNERLMSEEAERALAEQNISWQEEANNYVFEKKDFANSIPEQASALQFYNEAMKHYNEVIYLEKQKAALLNSTVIDKEAEQKILELQQKIDAEMVIVYRELSKANRTAYTENKREIALFLEARPNLKTEDPKLYRQIQSADVIYTEVGRYEEQAESFSSNSLKFDIYDQSQFMAEYVLKEQEEILTQLSEAPFTGELAFLSTAASDEKAVDVAATDFKISESELRAVVTKPAYTEYEKDLAAESELRSERKQLDALVIDERAKLSALQAERNTLAEAAAAAKGGKRKKLLKEAEVIDAKIAAREKAIDSIALLQVQNTEQQNVVSGNSQRVLRGESQQDRYNIVMVAQLRSKGADESAYVGAVETPTPAAVAETLGGGIIAPVAGSQDFEVRVSETEFVEKAAVIPTELEGDLFITTTSTRVTPYSAAKPIPVDEDIPSGLVFKVQIGAYRNPIPQDLFKGFAPLMGERMDNGITRYTAGLFRDFGNANRAKNEIRALGYDDAFVVAFMDGKRIPFNELRNLSDVDLAVPSDVAAVSTSPAVPKEVLSTPSTIRDRGQVSSAIAEQTVNTKDVQGIFFAVQVGVYSNTVLPQQLNGIRDLNSELLDNGSIRYSAGQFQTLEQAQARRDEAIRQGIPDAFVTAYENGIRITVGDAIQKINQ